ncbi:MAG: hypothetical protein ABIH34_07625 [Nanoarchaeota archaeon]
MKKRMEPLTLLIIVLVVLYFSIMLFLKATKRFIKLIFKVNLVIMIIIGLGGIYVYWDATQLREHFAEDPKLMILVEDSIVLSAVRLGPSSEVPVYIKEPELIHYQQIINKGDYSGLLENNHKIFIIELDTLLPLEGIDVGDELLNETDILAILKAEDGLRTFAEIGLRSYPEVSEVMIQNTEQSLAEQYGSSAEVKSRLFGVGLGRSIEKDPNFLIRQYKRDQVIIFPETIVFRIMRLVPEVMLDKVMRI